MKYGSKYAIHIGRLMLKYGTARNSVALCDRPRPLILLSRQTWKECSAFELPFEGKCRLGKMTQRFNEYDGFILLMKSFYCTAKTCLQPRPKIRDLFICEIFLLPPCMPAVPLACHPLQKARFFKRTERKLESIRNAEMFVPLLT